MSREVKRLRKCDLCHNESGKPETLYLHARCHMSAPLQASIDVDLLTLRCFLPECRRIIATFRVVKEG